MFSAAAATTFAAAGALAARRWTALLLQTGGEAAAEYRPGSRSREPAENSDLRSRQIVRQNPRSRTRRHDAPNPVHHSTLQRKRRRWSTGGAVESLWRHEVHPGHGRSGGRRRSDDHLREVHLHLVDAHGHRGEQGRDREQRRDRRR